MSQVELSEALLAQMGGQVWRERLKVARPILESDVDVLSSAVASDTTLASETLSPPAVAEVKTSIQSEPQQAESLPFILIGPGLETLWGDEENLEWQLLQNIARVFQWDLERLTYFDSDLMATEEAVMMTVEEVLALNVNAVMTLGATSLISEYFSEGFEMILLPSLESMLSDAYAKKMAYATLLSQMTSNQSVSSQGALLSNTIN